MFFDRPRPGTLTLLVHIEEGAPDPERRQEFHELAAAAELETVGCLVSRRRRPDPRTYIGRGKAEEAGELARAAGADLIIFDHELSSRQERNLEQQLQMRVMNRTALILEIFSRRAETHEGKLQVELAQLEHASTRLVRGWTHLDRQRGASGGQGVVGGVGETQLELDQRMLQTRRRQVEARLAAVQKSRSQNRRARLRRGRPCVALVGYTNAGKSTLFNRLSGDEVYVADQLFATLDPTLRRWSIAGLGDLVLADTVGFVRHLPHTLVEAFRATLEEVVEASLLLHVVDISCSEWPELVQAVNEVLLDIGAGQVPQLMVYNKIDLLQKSPGLDLEHDGGISGVWLSADEGRGLSLLADSVGRILGEEMVEQRVSLPASAGAERASLYELGAVLREQVDEEGGIHLDVRAERQTLDRILNRSA